MKIQPAEKQLKGDYTLVNDEYQPDEVYKRIEYLENEHLVFIKSDWSGWRRLFRDPDDGRYWELTMPQSEYHGGGPPLLTWLPDGAAKEKYDL